MSLYMPLPWSFGQYLPSVYDKHLAPPEQADFSILLSQPASDALAAREPDCQEERILCGARLNV